MNNKDQSIALPENINSFIQKVCCYSSSRKTKDRFIRVYKQEVEANEPILQERKVIKAQKETYVKAQLLGTALTNRGLNKFGNQYINTAATTRISTTSASATAEATASTSPMKKVI
jgi:hypothetical protein